VSERTDPQRADTPVQRETKTLESFWEQFLIPGEPSRRDWNTQEAFDAFVTQYPGKVPALNATKVLNGRDQYGMKGVF
jgi:hypothetical protein